MEAANDSSEMPSEMYQPEMYFYSFILHHASVHSITCDQKESDSTPGYFWEIPLTFFTSLLLPPAFAVKVMESVPSVHLCVCLRLLNGSCDLLQPFDVTGHQLMTSVAQKDYEIHVTGDE